MKFPASLTVAALVASIVILAGCDRLQTPRVTEGVRTTTSTTAINNDPDKIIGEPKRPVTVGDIEWTMNSVETALEVSDGSSSEQAAGRFLIIEMTATAVGTDDATIDQTQLQILDGINRKFLPSAKIHALDKKSLIPFPENPNEPVFENIQLNIKKGQPVTRYVLFDVPSDALALKLVVRDERLFATEAEGLSRKSNRRGVIDLMPLLQ